MNSTTIAPGILYFPRFVAEPDAALAEVMAQVTFTQRRRQMYGRTVATPRLEAWHGPTPYRFGGSELPAAPLPPVLQALAVRAEHAIEGAHLLRRKPSARPAARAARLAGASWATPDNLRLTLEHGSMLVMLRGVQAEWQHSVPKQHGCLGPRVNLTFRDCRS